MGVRCVWMMMVVMTATEAVVATEAHLLQHLTHKVVLDQQGNYVMLWEPLEDRIVIEVQVATRGYVILGFSTTGEMKGADIVLGWMDDLGRLFLHDRSSDGYTVPKVDESQDVELLGGYQNDTHTVLRFSRPWVTCDHNDIRLSDDTVRVIWAYGDEDPKDIITMKMHSAGGTKSVYLQVPQLRFPRLSDDVQTWELVSPNVSLPDDLTTLYWCKLYKMPPINRKVHIIGYVPVIKEENLPYIHHIQLYECHLPDSKRHFEKWLDVHGSQCFAPSTPISWYNCLSPIIAWAVGSEGEMYPDHVGLPIGEEYGGATYFMMEVHYDNPSLTPGVVDASGLRIFYTEVLRPNDAGLMVVGHDVSPKLIIPPNQSSWLTVGHCHGSCTGEVLPSGGVHVLQGLLHSHLLGSAISLRRVREGQELPAILQDMSYDFNYQQSRMLKQEVTILPGDHLITECNYDSSRRRAPTFGGLGTREEMCLAFLVYYPRVNLSTCTSQPSKEAIFAGLGIQEVYGDHPM
ncbi:DBH-like monooxygenase protein 1 [Panulirus ornatus]|uniref:DBH-like monooxygenase protein 1 n=1 Tax=Panulirus ornatus TaxID=150431 RepID=UPI003A866DA5